MGWTFSSCSEDDILQEEMENQQADNGNTPDFDYTIAAYDGEKADDEDRKGCLFSEGNLIFSGTGGNPGGGHP